MTISPTRSHDSVANTPTARQPDPVTNAGASSEWSAINRVRAQFIDHAEQAFLYDDMSVEAKKMVDAVTSPGLRGAPGVQVSTFAVDGAQSKDIIVIKRVPATVKGPNFVLYVPEKSGNSFHEFKTAEEMTAWIKALEHSPDRLDAFAQHFSHDAAPGQIERVKQKLAEFALNNTNAVVGSFAYEEGDIFTRLNRDISVSPAPVNGLSNTRLYKLEPDGNATYIGVRADGKEVLYKYDAYGNLHGGTKDGFYFVKNGLNSDKPLQLMSFNQYRTTVLNVSLDNVGANDLKGLYAEFIKQLRNPGHGLGAVLHEFGLTEKLAKSIEEIVKNPLSGTLVELNQDNQIGKAFGVDKETMDATLKEIGDEGQNRVRYYGTVRKTLNSIADGLESIWAVSPETTTVRTR